MKIVEANEKRRGKTKNKEERKLKKLKETK